MDFGDEHWMRKALLLAAGDRGVTWPNPAVGACLVRDGRLIAQARHAGAGSPHAEALALAQAGDAARGATLYVTLEPCNHAGRTPPCTRAILAAGVARVVFAARDTNPNVTGGGQEALAAVGIEVRPGLLAGVAWEVNHPFFETRGGQEPHVTLKLAVSADGRLAHRAGRVEDPQQRRVTGTRAHRRVHRLRARASCVVVGRGTVECDAPRLTARDVPGAKQPRPVVLDGRLTLSPTQLPPGALVLTAPTAPAGKERVLASAGLEVQRCAVGPDGRLAWPAVLAELQRRGLGIVLIEGGARVAGSLLEAEVPHRVHLFCAPRWLGGDGPALSGYSGPPRGYRSLRVRRVGDDVEWILRRPSLSGCG